MHEYPKPSPKTQKRVLGHERTATLPRAAAALSGGGRQDKDTQEHSKPVQETQKTSAVINKENPLLGTQKNGRLSGAAAVRKSTVLGCVSRFVYVTLDLPCKRASFVYLQAPITSHCSCRSRVARLRKKKLDRPWAFQKAHQLYPLRGRGRADLPKPTQTVVNLKPKVGSVGKHRSAVAAKPFYARNGTVSMRHESLAVVPRKFPLCGTNSHPAVQAVGLALLVRSAHQVTRHVKQGEKAGG